MSFFEKSLNTLELPAVLNMLSQQAVGDTAKERCLLLTPSGDPFEVKRRLDETEMTIYTTFGQPFLCINLIKVI